ncbi:MAG TPA: calcium-binding protein [Sphingomicrobium sp.]|nr:calcium-binding protein [Sphingomicrobium sp.]
MPIGPSTSTNPFLLASEPNVHFTSIVTSGDPLPSDGLFGGVPDGIGAFDNGDGTITVLVNHELGSGSGLVRDHGSAGAYIDRLVIDTDTLEIVAADDLIKSVMKWDDAPDNYVSATTAFNRFCSGDLPATSALYNSADGLGTQVRIYLTGEENTPEGRATATIVTGPNAGTLFELPSLGNLAFENIVANPYAQDKTIVALSDDSSPPSGNGQVYIYIGEKQSTGTEIDKAGLTGGDFYGIKVTGVASEANDNPINGTFTLNEIGTGGDVSNMTGAQIEAESNAEGVTAFLRPEDFAWDPDNPSVAYFTTTNSFTGVARVYQLTFNDITNPTAGGTVKAVIESDDLGAHMFDNLTVANGRVVVQEDPGNNAYVARVWEYDIASGEVAQVASFNPAQFLSGGPAFITQDEESSGVLDVTSLLGDSDTRAYLLDAQVHAATGNPATVEQGQLLVMYVDDPFLVGGNDSDALFGSAANETLRGNNGDDSARAGSGDDLLYGGNGNDTLSGDAGNDWVSGDNGTDTLIGGSGDDQLRGGNGPDYFIFDNRAETGNDRILDFTKPDHLLTTVQLSDSNDDGIIELGSGGSLGLFGSSSVTVDGAEALHFAGTVNLDGQTYYSYDLSGGSSKFGARIYAGSEPAFESHDPHIAGLVSLGHALAGNDFLF